MTLLRLTKPGAMGDRKNTVVDCLVLHTTCCPDLPRLASAVQGVKLVSRARKAGNIRPSDLDLVEIGFQHGDTLSDSLALCLINSANESRSASWHFCVSSSVPAGSDRCEVVEYVPPERQAHHVGPIGKPTNRRSIGIECCYPGGLSRRFAPTESDALKWFSSRGWGSCGVDLLPCPDGVKRWFAPQPVLQKIALTSLCADLCKRFPTINAICSHYLFAPTKRIDPDPPIDLAELRDRLKELTGRTYRDKPNGPPRRTP